MRRRLGCRIIYNWSFLNVKEILRSLRMRKELYYTRLHKNRESRSRVVNKTAFRQGLKDEMIFPRNNSRCSYQNRSIRSNCGEPDTVEHVFCRQIWSRYDPLHEVKFHAPPTPPSVDLFHVEQWYNKTVQIPMIGINIPFQHGQTTISITL